MLKYTDVVVTFAEVPNEISLCINISNCPYRCKNCHSQYLQKDVGKPLIWDNLNTLIHINEGISCVTFMGGNAKDVNNLAYHVKKLGLLTCWYTGDSKLSKDIELQNFNFIKIGPYIEELGPLNKKTTNQKFYEVVSLKESDNQLFDLKDKTYLFWNDKSTRNNINIC